MVNIKTSVILLFHNTCTTGKTSLFLDNLSLIIKVGD